MGRHQKFSTDDLLDAALSLFVEGGGSAVRVSAIAAKIGAPSGSVYHRFSGRSALVGELWNRTVERFQGALLPLLEDGAVFAAAREVLDWCASHPDEVYLLVAGPRFAGTERWPEEVWGVHQAQRKRLAKVLKDVSSTRDLPLERLLFALVDIPTASARHQHRAPNPLWRELALEAIGAVLAPTTIRFDWLGNGAEDRFRRIRLQSLLDAPEAFGSDFDEVVGRPRSSWTSQLSALPTVVATKNGRDVGVVRGCPGDKQWELLSLWVAPQARGCGVAEGLIHVLAERAQQTLFLDVVQGNAAAIRLYQRCGFVQESVVDSTVRMVLLST